MEARTIVRALLIRRSSVLRCQAAQGWPRASATIPFPAYGVMVDRLGQDVVGLDELRRMPWPDRRSSWP